MPLERIRLDDDSSFTAPTPVGAPLGQPVAHACTAGHRNVPDGKGSTGVWECSPGQFRRQVMEAEYSYIVSGEGSFTPDDGETIEFRAGDALYFTANTQGTWTIRQAVRKTYLILG
ncbi:cupin domain-containing protein [Metapseudomonas resinovorans]|uniref:(S)-ureidoglycine aminohydrolase cupin domain-containing protein n=1 Tax=Metapseudomonas resinovorans NBRC 106553 TaxID=1245471 RepID=S6AS14_METRE|nr:cupin domain-containing protein [Pseudomonas resinovorans]BAN48778.1 hypothetical protein PCA10_30460 [Pseudomonas resinovorans NBRC 106553]